MKLSTHFYLMIFPVVLIASQVAQAQVRPLPPSASRPVEGITGVRTGTNGNIELEFTFQCDNNSSQLFRKGATVITPGANSQNSPENNYCKSTLTDDDGLASIVAVITEVQREIKCHDAPSPAEWNIIKAFLKERAEHLRRYCHEVICNNQPNSEFREPGGSDRTTSRYDTRYEMYGTVMANCGKMALGIEKFLTLSDHPRIREKKGPFLNSGALTFNEVFEPLQKLIISGEMYQPPGRFHHYNVTHHSNGITRKESVWSPHSNATTIAKHHSRVRYIRDRTESSCNGVHRGRLADLLRRQRTPQPVPKLPPPGGSGID